MFRPPSKRAMTLVVTGAIALSAGTALASVVDIPQGSSSTKRQETRLVLTTQTEEVQGARQLMTTTPKVEEKALGPASKLVTESEIRSYRVPVTTHPLSREEKREITTTTTNFIRRTTTSVVDQTWPVWVYYRGGAWDGVSRINSTPTQFDPSQYANEGRRPPEPGMTEGHHQVYTAEAQSWRRTVYVEITPQETWMRMRLAYDPNLKFVAGYFLDNPEHGYSEVAKATVTRYHDHDAISVQAICNRHGKWWVGGCGTNFERTFHLNGFIVKTDTQSSYRDVTREEPYSTVSESPGPWTATGKMVRGAALTNPGLRYDPFSETVMIRQFKAMNDALAPKKLASSGTDVRKTFSADSSSGKNQAALSGSKVRQSLGANRVTPSRVASKGAGAPGSSGGLAGLVGNALPGQGLGQSVAPPSASGAGQGSGQPAAGSSATPPPAVPTPAPAPTPATNVSWWPWLQPAPQPTPTPTPTPYPWWFPFNPQTPPPSVRYENYLYGQ